MSKLIEHLKSKSIKKGRTMTVIDCRRIATEPHKGESNMNYKTSYWRMNRPGTLRIWAIQLKRISYRSNAQAPKVECIWIELRCIQEDDLLISSIEMKKK
jgi:hypothetical protein